MTVAAGDRIRVRLDVVVESVENHGHGPEIKVQAQWKSTGTGKEPGWPRSSFWGYTRPELRAFLVEEDEIVLEEGVWVDPHPPEVVFARALLRVEPEKRPEGSEERRRWLRLMMQMQLFVLETGLDAQLFQDALVSGVQW
jgi:hypothetical protein